MTTKKPTPRKPAARKPKATPAQAKPRVRETKAKGRPSAYKPEYCEQAKKLCALGATDMEIADFFKVSRPTIYRWMAAHPEFHDSIKNAKEAADARVERSLFQRAVGYEHDSVKIFMPAGAKKPVVVPFREHVPPDTVSMIYWLNNRKADEWATRKAVEMSTPIGKPMEHAVVTTEEFKTALADMVKLLR